MLEGIAALFASAIASFVAIQWATIITKVVVRLLILGVILAAFYLVLTAIQTAATGLTTSAPAAVQTFYTWLVPSNFSACMSAIITTQLIIWAWHWKQYAYNLMTGSIN